VAAPSRNVIEETWLAYAFEHATPSGRLDAALDRVGDHYGGLIAGPVLRRSALGERHGLALWLPDDADRAWPLWDEDGPRCAAASSVVTGWQRVVGTVSATGALRALAGALTAEPERLRDLNPPFAIAIRDSATDRMTIVNDALGAGRLYEMRMPDGWVWSNRLGALPIFAGRRPQPDPRGWAMFAAAGWFLGDSTPIRGTAKVPPGTVIEVRAAGDRSTVERRDSGAQRSLVEPRSAAFGDAADAAAAQAAGLAGDVDRSWRAPAEIDLSGGRDSRVSAAAAVAGKLEAWFKTADNEPGEVEVVRELVGAAPVAMRHAVNEPEAEAVSGELRDRVRAIHLVHDGMRNPQEVRRPMELPHAASIPQSMSGHGGEIGHGFYYPTPRVLRRLRWSGRRGLARRLTTAARRRHDAATAQAYELYLEECVRTLDAGRDHGLRGPTLLDFFYLAQRLPYRSGLGARSARFSACTTPGFVRAAFDLSPADRLGARLHREVIRRLVPAWEATPFFVSGSGRLPSIHRTRIWEKPAHARALNEMIETGSGWTEIFREPRIREMWAEIGAGGGSSDYEHVFYRLAWRVAFEDHLAALGRAAEASPSGRRGTW
jgi:hypothetical protein